MSESRIHLLRSGRLARLVIDNAQRRNAITRSMWHSLIEHCHAIGTEQAALAVIVSGSDGHFSAGADIGELADVFATPKSTADYNAMVQEALRAVAALDRPVVAAVEGVCFGGGVSLALQCDRVIAGADSRFAITPAKIGLVYGHADTSRLVDRIGTAAAKDLLFTGRAIDAETARSFGLVDEVVAAGGASAVAEAWCASLAPVSQLSIRAEKRLVDAVAAGTANSEQFVDATGKAATGPDFAEGRAAFLARRPAKFPSSGEAN